MKKMLFCTALAAAFSLMGCSLDETPKSDFLESDAFKSSKLIYLNTVANVYSNISNQLIGNPLGSIFTLQEYSSDATMQPGRGGDWVDGGKWQNIFLHNFDPSVDVYANIWNYLYKMVGLCNTSIDKLNEYKATNADAETYIYELRALRAYYYYNLMDLYAQVPVVTSSQLSLKDVNQSNRSEVFKFVVEELEDCLPHLSDAKSQNTGEYYGRVTKAVAYMCLAKCAINSPVYTIDNTAKTSYQAFVGDDKSKACVASETKGEAISALGKSISIKVDGESRNAWNTVLYCVAQIKSLGYDLELKYEKNFVVTNDNSVENIFTRPSDDVVYKVTNLMRGYSIHYQHGSGMGSFGANGFCATVKQMNTMHYGEADQDPRIAPNYYTGTDYIEDTGKMVDDGATDQGLSYEPLAPLVDFGAGSDAHDLKCSGARYKKYEVDKNTTSQTNPNNDIVIWRYADALLLKAEAEYRLGDKGTARSDLNVVRTRCGANPQETISLNIILNERACEFPWEAMRRQDQIRFATFTQPTVDRYKGVPKSSSASDFFDDTEGFTNVYPIPTTVLNLNKKLNQNPGY